MQATSDTGHAKALLNGYAGEGHELCELKRTLSDIEDLINSSSSNSSGSRAENNLIQLNERIRRRIDLANESLGIKRASMVQRLRDTSRRTNTYVHDQPWKAISAGVAVGALCGFLLAIGRASKPHSTSDRN